MNGGSLLKGIYYSIRSQLLVGGWLQHCVMSNKLITSLEENIPLVFHCCTLAGISVMAFSSVKATLGEIMGDGKPHALEIIALQLCQCLNKTTKKEK